VLFDRGRFTTLDRDAMHARIDELRVKVRS
jgi:hypothetical protein